MKTRIVEVNPYSDHFTRLQQFAQTFDHTIGRWRNGRVVAFERDERTFGYADILHMPVAFPAFHPEVATPRGIVEVVHAWKATSQLVYGGEGWIAVPLDEQRSTFPREMLESAGFAKMNREIYILKPQA